MAASAPDAAAAWWWSSALVAALVAGFVSLSTVWITEARRAKDRRRKLLAEAFAAAVRYREFVYRVRRRKDDGPDERIRLSEALSEVQERLAIYEALLCVEAPCVSKAYSDLVAATRDIAGGQIAQAWEQEPLGPGEAGKIVGVDFSGIGPHEDAFLLGVGDFLSPWPCWLRRAARAIWHWRRRRAHRPGGKRYGQPANLMDTSKERMD